MCEPSEKGFCPKHYYELVLFLFLKIQKDNQSIFTPEDPIFTSEILEGLIKTTKGLIYLTSKENQL